MIPKYPCNVVCNSKLIQIVYKSQDNPLECFSDVMQHYIEIMTGIEYPSLAIDFKRSL